MIASALALACILALPALATAQLPGPSVSVKLEPSSLSLDAGNSTTVTATVTYSDSVPTGSGTVQLVITPPEGWTAKVDPPTLTLGAGQTGTAKVTLTAPAAKTGAVTGALQLKADTAGGAGRAPATASATLQLARIDPALPAPPNLVPLYVGLALAILAIAAGVVWYARRRARLEREALAAAEAAAKAAYLARETGIQIQIADGPLPFGDKRESIWRVRVTNATERPRVAIVDPLDVPPGWRVAASIPRLPLSPGESVLISVYANPPESAAVGDHARLVIRARPEEAQEMDERVTIEAEVPSVRIPLAREAPVKTPDALPKSRFVLRR